MIWQQNPKTIRPKEMQLELPLQHSNESTAAEVEEQVKRLIGQLLRLMTFGVSLETLLEQEQQFSLGTPVMEVHMSSALLATVSLLMSTSDLLRTYTLTWKHLLSTTLSEAVYDDVLPECDSFIEDFLEAVHN